MNGQESGGGRSHFGWVGLAISLVSLAGVVVWATHQAPPQLPSSAGELAALGGAAALYGIATLIRCERWWLMLRHSGIRAGRGDAYALLVIGYMGNNVLPARGGDAIRTYLMARIARATIRRVLGTLVAERLLDAAVLVALFAVVSYGVLHGLEVPGGRYVLLVPGLILLAVAIGWLIARLARRDPRGRRVVEFLAPLARATGDLRGRYGLGMVGLTLAIWTVEATEVLAVGAATGLELNLGEALYLVAVAGVFLLIPAGPGNLGTLDAGVAFGVRAIGGTGSEAVSFLLALRVILIFPITIAGFVLLAVRYGGFHRIRSSRAGAVHP